MAIYLNYNNIPGDVTESEHTAWIELPTFKWGVTRDITGPTGASADRESSSPFAGEVVVTKDADISSTKLLNEAYQGTGQTAIIDFTGTNSGARLVYFKITLSDTLISGFSHSSGGERPVESVSLDFTKIAYSLTNATDTNADGWPDTITYDLAPGQGV